MSSLALLQSLKESILSQANVKAIYGEPVAVHGKTVIPVAKIIYGYGAGAGTGGVGASSARGEGGGGGGGGLGVRQSREWFTVSLLAQALHISRDEVRKWIDRGWLQCRVVQAQSVKVQIIYADDFCAFVKNYGREVIGNRLSYEGLAFVRDYVFPRSHADLLSLRGPYNKARTEPAGQARHV